MPSYEAVPVQSGATYSFLITSNGGSNGKSSWFEMVNATGIDCASFWITPFLQSTNQRTLIDIGLGSAASEVILIADFMYFAGNASNQGAVFNAQVNADIPTGTRIAVRIQQDVAFDPVHISLMLIGDSTEGLAAPTTYGAFTSGVTTGTSVDPGAVANTKGLYSQITTATGAAHKYITACFGDRTNPTTVGYWAMDVAIGSAASEVIIIPDLKLRGNSGLQAYMHGSNYWEVDEIPDSTRLAVRGASTVNAGGARLIDCILIAGEVPAAPIVSTESVAVF